MMFLLKEVIVSFFTAMMRFAPLAFLMSYVLSAAARSEYGVDCSFPIHSKQLKCGNLLGDRKSFYEEYMEGCREYYGDRAELCDETEDDRIQMNRIQPKSMVNYTSTGYGKLKAPKRTMEILLDYWNKNHMNEKVENWNGK
jgi:hypothetical protein